MTTPGLRARATLGLARRYPFLSGSAKFANKPWGRRVAAQHTWPQTVQLRRGPRVRVVNDFVGRSVFLTGDLDPKITTIVASALRAGDCMLDVGANVGVVSLVGASVVGPSGVVHAIEPQPDLAAMLRATAADNGYQQLLVHEVALSRTDGSFALSVPGDNRGAASLEDDRKQKGPSIMVPVRQASDYLAELDLPPVRIMKIDIEGHESAFLSGAEHFLVERPPTVVLLEEQAENRFEAASLELLRGLGYTLFGLPRALFTLRPTAVTRQNANSFHDFLALHRSADDPLRRALHL